MALSMLVKNAAKYKQQLEEEIQKRADSPKVRFKQLNIFAQPDRARVATDIYQPTLNGRLNITYPIDPDQTDQPEELVCTVQGYALRVNLPPITSKYQLPKNAASARQSIMLTGLGAAGFDTCARAILELHAVLASRLPANSLQPWKPTTDRDNICIEFSNRYFATNSDQLTSEDVDLKEIDPMGILCGMVPTGRHTEDNVVLYFDRQDGQEHGQSVYKPCNPTSIKPGQMVEAQVAFAAVPIAKGKYIMLLKLRSVCILDRQLQKDLDDEVINSLKKQPVSPMKKVKRTVGYGNDESPKVPMSQFKKMRIDDVVEGSDMRTE